METFAAGQMVSLRGGGPDMLVEKVSSNELMCVWFAKREVNRAIFDKSLVCHNYDSAVWRQKQKRVLRRKLKVIK